MNFYIEAGILQVPRYTGCQVYTYNILAEMAAIAPEDNFHLHFAMDGWYPQIDELLTHPNLVGHRFHGAVGRHLAQSFNILRTHSRSLYYMNGYTGLSRVPLTCPTAALFHDMRLALCRDIYGDAVCDDFIATTNKWIHGCDCIVTGTETVKHEIADFFKIPLERIILAPESVEHHPHDGVSTRPKSLPEGDYPIFLMVNPGEVRKNWQDVLAAFALYIRQHPNEKDVRLVLAGGLREEETPVHDRLKANPELAARTTLTGYVQDEELRWLYQNARFMLYPSRYEGFGIPILEAMEQDVPALLSDIPVFRDVAQDAARFVPLDHPQEMADVMHEIHSSEAVRQELIQKGRKRVKDFSWKRSAQTTLNMLRTLSKK